MFLGSHQDGDQTIYNQSLNELLEHAVTSTTDITGTEVTQRISNADYATEAAAVGFARVLGAQVNADAKFGTAVSSVPKRVLILPNGRSVAAGSIAGILGNDALYPGPHQKSGAIAE